VNHEFMVTADSGESLIFSSQCGYAASSESAKVHIENLPAEKEVPMERRETPGRKTVEEVSSFLGVEPARLLKSLVFLAGDEAVLAVVPGDRELNEAKLARVLGHPAPRLATAEEIQKLTGGPMGFTGPAGSPDSIRTILDASLQENRNYVTGGNARDVHLVNVRIGRDVKAGERADLVTAREGDRCPRCGDVMRQSRGIEVGHIFKLGTKYSESMGATVLTQDGKPVPIVMGSYGIGVERIITAAVEQNYDENGIIWPKTLAPFDVVVTITNVKDEKLRQAGDQLYQDLQHGGLDVLLDDRDERAGVKFKDADLIGIPYRITMGKKIADGMVELFDRRTKQSEDVKLADIVAHVQKLALAGV